MKTKFNFKWPALILLALLVVIALLLIFIRQDRPRDVQYGVELIRNGDFELQDGEGFPENWLPEAYVADPDVTEFSTADGMEGKGIRIRNLLPNDARYFQTVRVSPSTYYRFSGYVRASAVGGRGANLSVAGIYVFSEAVYDTNGAWKEIEFYGKTGAGQREVTLFARLGGYSGEAEGEAYFDKLSLMALEDAPSGVMVPGWDKQAESGSVDTEEHNGGKPFAPWLLLISLVFSGLLYWLAAQSERQALNQGKHLSTQQATAMLLLLLLLAFLTRLFLAVSVPGFPVDVNAFRAWSNDMAAVGPSGFYLQEGHRDYPPGYMLMLWPIGLLGQMLGTGATGLMIKLPSILADLGVLLLLYRFAVRKANPRAALLLACLYALNPLTYLAGAAWGQVDSLPSLLLMAAVLFIMERKWRFALPVYVLAVLIKPQALMAGPLGLLALAADFYHRRDGRLYRDVLYGFLGALLTAAVVVLPFFNSVNGLPWLFGLYGKTMGFYSYASVNAANLYFLFGQNWAQTKEFAPFLLRLAGFLAIATPLAFVFFKNPIRGRSQSASASLFRLIALGTAALPAIVTLFPMSIKIQGILLMVSVFLAVAAMYLPGKEQGNLPLLAGILLTGFSLLGTMMHERYLFLAAALFTLAYFVKRDRRILVLLIAVSALCFLNSGVALDRGIRIGGADGNLDAPVAGLVSDSAWLEYTLSFLSLPLLGYSLYQGFVLSDGGRAVKAISVRQQIKTAETKEGFAFLQKFAAVKFDRKDALFILLVTALYAILAFVNLGSGKSPQNAWVSGPEQAEAVLDLGAERDFNLLFFGGIHRQDCEFEVAVSSDGLNYQESYPFQIQEGGLFSWRYLSHPYQTADGAQEYDSLPRALSGRYVRISGMTAKLTLMEVIAQDTDNGENLPFAGASEGAEALIDEQGSFSGRPSWFNSMYFDEIYHARTAFEQRNAILGIQPSQIYETSHPPLGKVLMTFSVMLFGMTPFGWRFAGALAGVLMLPGLYLLGKQLTGKRSIGMLAMLLMAFDFMHFAQTRIATIDSFATLFIIYAYFFMLRYLLMDRIRAKLQAKLVPLILSGLMMGFAIASKWTGIYAGAGLAVLFFYALIRDCLHGYRLQKAGEDALRRLGDEAEDALRFSRDWLRQAALTCLFCLLFFIVIPLLIYYLSYIPVFMATPGGLTVKKVIDANLGMYNYHSQPGFGADHPWASPWYSWPIIKKPMYFYSGGVMNGTASVIWSFGNPLVWWGGLLGLLMILLWAIYQRFSPKADIANHPLPGHAQRVDSRLLFLLVAFAAQYLPWALVPRGTYIYHYFPSVPFIILCLAVVVDRLTGNHPKTRRAVLLALPAIAGLLFIAFFPYISGVRVSTAWLDALRWFPGWLYY